MLKITSSTFGSGARIPARYTCDGANVNPPLRLEQVPAGTKSFVIIVSDPDSPSGNFTHWIAWNIDGTLTDLREGETPPGARFGVNDFGHLGYGGPCPHVGEHRYFFRVYALNTLLDLPNGSTRAELELAVTDHILDKGELMGRYARPK